MKHHFVTRILLRHQRYLTILKNYKSRHLKFSFQEINGRRCEIIWRDIKIFTSPILSYSFILFCPISGLSLYQIPFYFKLPNPQEHQFLPIPFHFIIIPSRTPISASKKRTLTEFFFSRTLYSTKVQFHPSLYLCSLTASKFVFP